MPPRTSHAMLIAMLPNTPSLSLWQVPRIRREERWLAGVASAVAVELGVDVVVIRLSFVLLTLAGGLGLALYAAAWIACTWYEREHPERTYQPVPKGASPVHRMVAVASIVGGCALIARNVLAISVRDAVFWPVAIAAFGMLLAWSSGKMDWAAPYELVRAGGGLMLVALGVIGFIALEFGAAAAPRALLVGTALLSGVVLVVAPWLWRAATQVSEAKLERLRIQERAELAAHLHDSVLQTLSLIQRSAGDRAATVRLARLQERELREWLFQGAPSQKRTPAEKAPFLRSALNELASAVEARYGVPIEVVVVGDGPVDERMGIVLSASREAMVNAARHSGAARVDVFSELSPEALEVFIRDTGRGFDSSAVPADRGGLRESITGRLERVGGRAQIRSELGRGTEVILTLNRDYAA